MKMKVKRKILREGDELPISQAVKEIKPLATFRVNYRRDGKPVVALEVWYLEIETP